MEPLLPREIPLSPLSSWEFPKGFFYFLYDLRVCIKILLKTLLKLELTTPEETDIICSAIYHHDDKLTVDSPMDEVLKDADVIHHCVNDLSKPIKEKEQARFDSLMKEFGVINIKE